MYPHVVRLPHRSEVSGRTLSLLKLMPAKDKLTIEFVTRPRYFMVVVCHLFQNYAYFDESIFCKNQLGLFCYLLKIVLVLAVTCEKLAQLSKPSSFFSSVYRSAFLTLIGCLQTVILSLLLINVRASERVGK